MAASTSSTCRCSFPSFDWITKMMRKTMLAAALTALTGNAQSAAVDVLVPTDSVTAGETFAVDLVADLAAPVLGWGLDIDYDANVLSLESVSIADRWIATASADGDGLVGRTFPDPVSGDDVLLATLRFRALAA